MTASAFKQPDVHLVDADACELAALLSAASDLTVVVDGSDVVRDLSHALNLPRGKNIRWWRGKPIDKVVHEGSQAALRSALGEARCGKTVRRFEINHVVGSGAELPMQYSAMRIAEDGRVVLMGRDMRALSGLRAELLASRRSAEQTARGRRQSESQYRLLFEAGSDPIVMVEAESGKVRDINQRAASILALRTVGAEGRKFASLFGKAQQGEVAAIFSRVAVTGQAEKVHLRGGPILSMKLFRAGGVNLVMVRIGRAPEAHEGGDDDLPERRLTLLARNATEAIVLVDAAGAVVWANEAFLSLADLPVPAQAVGRPVFSFLQWSSVEREIIFENARRHGRVGAFPAVLYNGKGNGTDVAVSVVAMDLGGSGGYGLIMRLADTHASGEQQPKGDDGQTAESIAGMIGRIPMKDLVRERADGIERMCIEAALRLTGNNRASTARVLGLSRQALYLKMNRFGITDGE
ncbi:MAG: transcriptional regulator PpsR [Rhizobiaceae bacterium]|nr:transcriptional regulator PpsR [Rhizobiaceae bacterium]